MLRKMFAMTSENGSWDAYHPAYERVARQGHPNALFENGHFLTEEDRKVLVDTIEELIDEVEWFNRARVVDDGLQPVNHGIWAANRGKAALSILATEEKP